MTGEWWVNVLKLIHRLCANENDIIIDSIFELKEKRIQEHEYESEDANVENFC